MKIVCPSCGTENIVSKEAADSAEGGLIDVSCQKCGSILPAVSARDVLNELRNELADELADELGDLFDEAPQREVQTSTMMIGGSDEPPISSPKLQTPAFSAHDSAQSSQPRLVDSSAVEQAAASPADSQSEQAEPDNSEKEESWSPSAAGLDSLISEEYENAAARKTPETEDKLLLPPEIKKKTALEHTPSPAFDADFLTDPELRRAVSAAQQGPLLSNNPSVITEAPQRNTSLVVLVTLGIVAIIGMLGMIIFLLLRPSSPVLTTQGTQNQAPTQQSNPQVAALVDASTGSSAIGAVKKNTAQKIAAQQSVDAATAQLAKPRQSPDARTKLLAQAAAQKKQDQSAENTARPLPKNLFDDDESTVSKPAARRTKTATKSGRTAKGYSRKSTTQSASENKTPKKPVRKAGHRPKGCDPLIYPDPMECPHAAPPGKAEILAVVRAHLGEVDACAKKQFAVDPALASGTIKIRFWIRPTGKTTRVAVINDEFKQSIVGKCLTKKISAWDFGTFDGRKIGPIKFPFRLRTK